MSGITNKIYGIILLLLTFTYNSGAQSLNVSDFRAVVGKIKQLNRYSYNTVTTAVFPNGKTDVLKTTTYMDTRKMNYAYKTDHEQVIMNNKWFFRAHHSRKFVSVFDLKKYSEKYPGPSGDLSAVFKSSLATDFLDSVVTSGGKLKTAKREGNIASFEFEFHKDAPLKSLVLKFNESSGLPEYIYMNTSYEDRYGKKTSYKIVCNGYTGTFSDAAFNTDDLFSVSGGKVSMLKYKNYKISSIL